MILGFVLAEDYKQMTHPGPSLGILQGHAAELREWYIHGLTSQV